MNIQVDIKVIERIEKLLALATSSNEHEAKLAASMAQKLLLAHNLDIETIKARDVSDYTDEIVDTSRVLKNEAKFVCGILQTYFFVRPIRTRTRFSKTDLILIGTKTNVTVARFVYDFLTKKFVELFEAYRIKHRLSIKARSSFYLGLYHGLCEQLTATQTQYTSETGLVVVKDSGLDNYIDEKHGKLRSQTYRRPEVDERTLAHGYEQGKSLKIARGLDDSTSTSRLGGTRRIEARS